MKMDSKGFLFCLDLGSVTRLSHIIDLYAGLTGQDSNQGTDESGPSGSGPSGSGPSGSGPSGNDPSGSGPSGNMATMDTTPGPSNSSSSAKPKPNLKQGSAGAVVDPKCTAKLTKVSVLSFSDYI